MSPLDPRIGKTAHWTSRRIYGGVYDHCGEVLSVHGDIADLIEDEGSPWSLPLAVLTFEEGSS